jgi:hypothetical protein
LGPFLGADCFYADFRGFVRFIPGHYSVGPISHGSVIVVETSQSLMLKDAD